MDPLLLRAAGFSAAAILIFGGATWFFFFSPIKSRPAAVSRPGRLMAGFVVAALGLGGVLMVTGALWDASMHVQTGTVPGGSDFLWPPHIMLYSGFLLSFVCGLAALVNIAIQGWKNGSRDPRRWMRQNPRLGAVALSSGFTLLSIPGDALWHELFGVDLTAWSPPHVLIAIMGVTCLACAAGLFSQSFGPLAGRLAGAWKGLVVSFLLSLVLSQLYTIGVLEWELPGGLSHAVAARPIWLYPVVGGTIAFLVLFVAKKISGWRWSALATSAFFYLVRLGTTAILLKSGDVAPLMPLWFILAAFLMDAIHWNWGPAAYLVDLLTGLAFTIGYLALFPVTVNPYLAVSSKLDWAVGSLVLAAASLLLAPAIGVLSRPLVLQAIRIRNKEE